MFGLQTSMSSEQEWLLKPAEPEQRPPVPQQCFYILICVMDLFDKALGASAASGEKDENRAPCQQQPRKAPLNIRGHTG